MRIVVVLNSLGMGGAEKQALAVADGMVKRGHAVLLLVLRTRRPDEWATTLPAVHLNLSKSPVSFAVAFLRARRVLREFKPDLLHSHSFHSNLFARLLRLAGAPVTVVSTVHNVYEGGRHRMWLYRVTDRLSRRTVFVSKAAEERFADLRAVSRSRSSVIANGIDTAEFAPDVARRSATRSAMGVFDSRFIWFTAGRLVAAKDLPNLLSAFWQVLGRFPDAELWIAGAPRDAKPIRSVDGKTDYAWLTAMESAMRDQVRWLGLRRDVAALLDAADAFVLASAWEGMPLVVGEAMAMEKAIVVTNVGGVGELVGDAGDRVEAKNPAALAEAMIAVMSRSRESLAARGVNARRRVQERFEMSSRIEAWEALYGEMIGKREMGNVNRES